MPEPRTIFLVDDDADFLEMEKSILTAGGYRVRSFTSPGTAREALAAAPETARPSLLVTDLMMDALDSGFSFARSLKSDPLTAKLPVIIVSAASSQKGFDFRPRSPADLTAMGAEAFFSKPITPAAFLAKVKELLG